MSSAYFLVRNLHDKEFMLNQLAHYNIEFVVLVRVSFDGSEKPLLFLQLTILATAIFACLPFIYLYM